MRQEVLTEVNAKIPVFRDVALRCSAERADVSFTVMVDAIDFWTRCYVVYVPNCAVSLIWPC
jgi:hypothetical protein